MDSPASTSAPASSAPSADSNTHGRWGTHSIVPVPSTSGALTPGISHQVVGNGRASKAARQDQRALWWTSRESAGAHLGAVGAPDVEEAGVVASDAVAVGGFESVVGAVEWSGVELIG